MALQTITPNPLIAHPLTDAIQSTNEVQKFPITLQPGEIRTVVFTVDGDATNHVVAHLLPRNGESPDKTRLRNGACVLGPGGATCHTLKYGVTPTVLDLFIVSRDDDAHALLRIETIITTSEAN